jgi:hypothetical protein
VIALLLQHDYCKQLTDFDANDDHYYKIWIDEKIDTIKMVKEVQPD